MNLAQELSEMTMDRDKLQADLEDALAETDSFQLQLSECQDEVDRLTLDLKSESMIASGLRHRLEAITRQYSLLLTRLKYNQDQINLAFKPPARRTRNKNDFDF